MKQVFWILLATLEVACATPHVSRTLPTQPLVYDGPVEQADTQVGSEDNLSNWSLSAGDRLALDGQER